MIAASSSTSQPQTGAAFGAQSWRRALADAITDPAELLSILQLDPALLPAAQHAATRFPLRVPRGFVARMRPGDPKDPLLRQVLPLADELLETEGYTDDAVGDLASRAAPNLLHKYEKRALILATGACGVHCRYCFRRHYPYSQEHTRGADWQVTLDYLRSDASIQEIILSGGDPLTLGDRRLAAMCADLQTIPHLRRLRIHTRQPIVLPERVDQGFCAWLDSVRLRKIIVLHCNHAQEIDASVRDACTRLAASGATLFNQAVLLAGINDSAEALCNLSEALFAAQVSPYYLHMLDRVQGAAHFDVPEARARTLLAEVAAQLPGYLVPRLVREVPGAKGKTSVTL